MKNLILDEFSSRRHHKSKQAAAALSIELKFHYFEINLIRLSQ